MALSQIFIGGDLCYNWLQVLGATELAQIDQRVCQQLHAIVPLLDMGLQALTADNLR